MFPALYILVAVLRQVVTSVDGYEDQADIRVLSLGSIRGSGAWLARMNA